MSREKQIEEMAREVIGGCEECSKCPLSFDCKAYEYATKFYNAGYRKPSEWISVEDRLPDKSDWYLVNIIDHFGLDKVTLTNYTKTFGWNVANVTHWMPLPEAPKMKGGE